MAEADNDEFNVWINRQPSGPGQLGTRGAVIKRGSRVCKTVSISEYGDLSTGVVSRRELTFQSAQRLPNGRFDFERAQKWRCGNEELQRLVAFLSTDVDKAGRYRVVDTESPMNAVTSLLAEAEVDVKALAEVLGQRGDLADLARALTSTSAGYSALERSVLEQRRSLVAKVKRLVQRDDATETAVHGLVKESYWIFGGRYVGVEQRRRLIPLDEHDVALVTNDGTLHIVELKGPVVPRLVHKHRGHLIVGRDVHEAVAQAINYLRSIDELGSVLSTTYRNEGLPVPDMRRTFATVIIGHPAHVADTEERLVDQTIRSYNAHLSRVEVVTYKNLLDAADRALVFEEDQLT